MKSSLYKSIFLHLAVYVLLLINLSSFWTKKMDTSQIPIIVDLDQINISDITNLPARAEFADETRQASSTQKPQQTYEKPEPKQPDANQTNNAVVEPTPAEETPTEPDKDFIVPPQPSKPELKDKPSEPKRPTPPPQPKKPKAPEPAKKPDTPRTKPADNMLKNLMDSVNAMEQNLGQNNTATIKTGTQVANMGIEGGSGGSYFSELSITEVDAIASRLRACWNLDPGARGIEDMIIEIRAFLNRDATVARVDILNMSRYNSDPHFRSIAESARRAVHVCEPFYKVLAEKYPERYEIWRTMLLRFNPINQTVN